LDDPKNVARDVSEIGHWGNGDYEVFVKSTDDLNFLMTLIKQSFAKTFLNLLTPACNFVPRFYVDYAIARATTNQ